ncbi:hypothetical protein pb186bvf_016727 [Paramecium bursaria]
MRKNVVTKKVQKQQKPPYVQDPILWIRKTIYHKFCQSQNYYYTRDINEIMAESTTKAVIRFKDWITMDDDEEYLKRFYKLDEYPQKIQLLTEYYKFHTDITRIFMEPIATILNKYYDKKRKFEYYRIAKLIEEENKKNPQRPPKGIVGDRPSPVNSQDSDTENEDNGEQKDDKKKQKNFQILKDISWLQAKIKPKVDISSTLTEICKNLQNIPTLHEQSFIVSSNQDDTQLNKFINYITNKKPEAKQQIKRLSQPQEILMQTLIQQQQQKMQNQDKKMTKKTDMHQKTQSLANDIQFNIIKQQSISSQKSTKLSTEAFNTSNIRQSQKNLPSPVDQRKSPVQYPRPQISPTNFRQKKELTNKFLEKKLNLKQIAKILIEDDLNEQELKWKNGSQTHRPLSGQQNFFNSNRQSPGVNLQIRGNPTSVSQKFKTINNNAQKLLYEYNFKTNQQQPCVFRKSTQQNGIVRHTSNQDRVININININDQPYKNQSKHKKHYSDSKPTFLKESVNPIEQDYVCLTDRNGQIEFQFKNQSPRSQLRDNKDLIKNNAKTYMKMTSQKNLNKDLKRV